MRHVRRLPGGCGVLLLGFFPGTHWKRPRVLIPKHVCLRSLPQGGDGWKTETPGDTWVKLVRSEKEKNKQTYHPTHKTDTMPEETAEQKSEDFPKELQGQMATAFTLSFMALMVKSVTWSLMRANSASAKEPRRDGGFFSFE